MATPKAPLDIVKILRVVDTREYVEDGDRWVPIPGSGDARQCDRCGRTHEVHAEVELADKRHAVVGTGCMTQESMQREARNLAAAVKRARIKQIRAERLAAQQAAWDRAWAEVSALEVPRHTVARVPTPDRWSGGRFAVTVGDAMAYGFGEPEGWNLGERIECATDYWRRTRMTERGLTRDRPC